MARCVTVALVLQVHRFMRCQLSNLNFYTVGGIKWHRFNKVLQCVSRLTASARSLNASLF